MNPLVLLVPVVVIGGYLYNKQQAAKAALPVYFPPLAGSVVAPAILRTAPRSNINLAGYGTNAPDMHGSYRAITSAPGTQTISFGG